MVTVEARVYPRHPSAIQHDAIVKTHLFPIKTSGEQYSIVPQNVENFFPSSMYAADPKSINLI